MLKTVLSVAALLIPGSSVVLLILVLRKAYIHYVHGRMEKEAEELQA